MKVTQNKVYLFIYLISNRVIKKLLLKSYAKRICGDASMDIILVYLCWWKGYDLLNATIFQIPYNVFTSTGFEALMEPEKVGFSIITCTYIIFSFFKT